MKQRRNDLAGLETMAPTQLREHWTTLGTGAAPAVPTTLLRRLLAQRLQERRHGAIPVMVARELERIAGKPSTPAPVAQRPVLNPGTRLIREWNGQTIAVEVMEDGQFNWNWWVWHSLSEIARAVTGAHWSGPRFFGLTRRG